MKKALNALGYPVSRNKARKLMREANMQARQRRKYKVTTNSNHRQPVYDNLLNREFDVEQLDQVDAADVAYIWTQEGWLYLAVVIDLCSRKVAGWSMSSRMKAPLVCDALKMAIKAGNAVGLTANDINAILDYILSKSSIREIFYLWRPFLKDSNDDLVLEVAVESQSKYIITCSSSDLI